MTDSQQVVDHIDDEQQKQQIPAANSPTNSSPSNSISLIKLDELSSFGATKQNRLPVLIKLNSSENRPQANSMPAFSVDQIEQSKKLDTQQVSSLPVQVNLASDLGDKDKENIEANDSMNATDCRERAETSDDFQVVDMVTNEQVLLGPSLPPAKSTDKMEEGEKLPGDLEQQFQRQALNSVTSVAANQHYPSHLGDSLIEMIINLRNENQNLVRALETNNDYVKERLDEFKRIQEEAKRREAQFALEKAEHEHQNRKLQRQNQVLSERLKSMEAKLKELKLEVSDSLNAAHSSKASSIRDENAVAGQLYPRLEDSESFGNSALVNQTTTMQIDATNGELLNDNDEESDSETGSESEDEAEDRSKTPTAPEMEAGAQMGTSDAARLSQMSKEELSKRFDADKAQFYAMDDPMKQCDELERQLNDIGKRDYEICLLQQQLNIYRQDFRLERMAKLEARIQIEKLKNDIDRLCLERIQDQARTNAKEHHNSHRHRRHRLSAGRLDPAVAAAEAVFGKLGHQLSRKAAKSAAKAAKYAAKQAHREEKAAAFAAATAAAAAATSGQDHPMSTESGKPEAYHGHMYHHRRHHSTRPKGIRSEVVNDLLSTANKAMLTGYKMASTHVNLALDKLSAYEQAQASNLASNKATTSTSGNVSGKPEPSAPLGPPSID